MSVVPTLFFMIDFAIGFAITIAVILKVVMVFWRVSVLYKLVTTVFPCPLRRAIKVASHFVKITISRPRSSWWMPLVYFLRSETVAGVTAGIIITVTCGNRIGVFGVIIFSLPVDFTDVRPGVWVMTAAFPLCKIYMGLYALAVRPQMNGFTWYVNVKSAQPRF